MSRILGIDLGTTNSAMAIVNEYGRPEIITNRDGDRVTPSVVLFVDDEPTVGSAAKQAVAERPLDIVQFVKRQMGKPASEWNFLTTSGKSFTAEEISAFILKRLKADAEAYLQEPVNEAVITVPAYFDDARRKATQDAGRIAGLKVLRIINEPTAAALAYGTDATRSQTVLVYDLGGGTFDATIMQIEKGDFKVLATGGSPSLGGFDWDSELMTWLNDEFKQRGGPDLMNDPANENTLRVKAELAKRQLSQVDQTNVTLDAAGFHERVTVARADFDTLTRPLLMNTSRFVEQVLEDAELAWSGIDKLLLVGGSTRMRQVAELLSTMSGKQASIELNPDEVVALGAAVQAAILSGTSIRTTGGEESAAASARKM